MIFLMSQMTKKVGQWDSKSTSIMIRNQSKKKTPIAKREGKHHNSINEIKNKGPHPSV